MRKGLLFPIVSEDYYHHCIDVGMTSQTLICKRSVIDSQLNPYFQSYFIDELTENDVVKFKDHILKQNFSKEYNIHIMSTLSCIIKFCVKSNIIPKNICGYSTIFKEINRCEVWNPKEYDKFISYFDDDLMFKTFYSILFQTNLYQTEVRSLTIEDIDLSKQTISTHQKWVRKKKTKGKRERMRKLNDDERKTVSISVEVVTLLREYILSNHSQIDEVLFPIKYTEVFQKIRESCDYNHIKEIKLHSQKNYRNKYIF